MKAGEQQKLKQERGQMIALLLRRKDKKKVRQLMVEREENRGIIFS